MSISQTLTASYEFNRGRTLELLDRIEDSSDPQAALAWRPGLKRAHIGWQIMHIGITEEIFATERLLPEKPGCWTELWPRFRGGSTPDDDVPTLAMLRTTLSEARQHLLETLTHWGDQRLGEIPAALAQRGLTYQQVLHIIAWHEAHHQGQAHAVFNLYQAQQS
jgi:uncharacterized damage-inducible protein DinB